MTAKELIEQLQKVAPDTEIIGGTWNGHVDTYTVIDRARVFLFDQVYADFFGTPGAFDDRLMKIKSKEIVYLGSEFESLNKRMVEDRRVIWRMRQILDMHRAKEWKKEQIFKILADFGNEIEKQTLFPYPQCQSDAYLFYRLHFDNYLYVR